MITLRHQPVEVTAADELWITVRLPSGQYRTCKEEDLRAPHGPLEVARVVRMVREKTKQLESAPHDQRVPN